MEIAYYHIDTFTDRLFSGNPAVVCVLVDWLSDDLLQHIATEMNQPQTAFVVPRDAGYHIRWFTPTREVDVCGHSTLAAGYVVLNFLEPKREGVVFQSACGPLTLTKKQSEYILDLPGYEYHQCETTPAIEQALQLTRQMKVVEIFCSRSYLVVMENERQLRSIEPDYRQMASLDLSNLIVTAPGDHNIDFVSRYFAPSKGVNEDNVTASAFCLLVPYWSEKLGKSKLHGKQISKRPGEVQCELKGERVLLHAKLVLVASGKLQLI
ncbi:MAG: PhzF family phenazine biosynthesis protein [Pseudomonadota bacterium]